MAVPAYKKQARKLLSRFPKAYDALASVDMMLDYYVRRERAAEDFLILNKIEQKDGLAIDIGAHRGRAAVRLGIVQPTWRIISFEPNLGVTPFLERAKRLLGERYDYHPVGLGEEPGELEYMAPLVNSIAVTAEGSFDERQFDNPLLKKRLGVDWFPIQKTKVEVRRLDDYGLSPTFVKIDVQGFEGKVLRGMRETIERCRPLLYIERNKFSLPEVLEYLKPLGYTPYLYNRQRQCLAECDPFGPRIGDIYYVTEDFPYRHVLMGQAAGPQSRPKPAPAVT